MKIVPMNFGFVTEGIVRSAMPEAKHFPFLESLDIKTCVILSTEGPSAQFRTWMTENGVQALDLLRGKPTNSIQEPILLEALTILLQGGKGRILITCPMGRYWTGTVVGCYRKITRWSLSSILEEYRRFTGGKGRLENEEFIELFDVENVPGSAWKVSQQAAIDAQVNAATKEAATVRERQLSPQPLNQSTAGPSQTQSFAGPSGNNSGNNSMASPASAKVSK